MIFNKLINSHIKLYEIGELYANQKSEEGTL